MQEDAPFFGGTASTSVACDEPMPVTLVEEPDGLYLRCTVPQAVADTRMQVVTSDMLGVPRIVEERYEQPDGSDYVLDTDLLEQALDGNGTQGRGVEWSCLRRESHPNLGMEQLI